MTSGCCVKRVICITWTGLSAGTLANSAIQIRIYSVCLNCWKLRVKRNSIVPIQDHTSSLYSEAIGTTSAVSALIVIVLLSGVYTNTKYIYKGCPFKKENSKTVSKIASTAARKYLNQSIPVN